MITGEKRFITNAPLADLFVVFARTRPADENGTGSITLGGDRVEGDQVSRDNVAQVAAAVLDHPAAVHEVIEFNDGDTPILDAFPRS